MKCKYLTEVKRDSIVGCKVAISNSDFPEVELFQLFGITGIDSNCKCPKKKQPCEINARCWRLGNQ